MDCGDSKILNHGFQVFWMEMHSKVLIFCVEFWELSHLTRDLSQGEKKINVVTS